MNRVPRDSKPLLLSRAVSDPAGPVSGSRMDSVPNRVWPGQHEVCMSRMRSGTACVKTGIPASLSCPFRKITAAKTGRRHPSLRVARRETVGKHCIDAGSGHDDTIVQSGQGVRRLNMAGFLHGAFTDARAAAWVRQSAVSARCGGIQPFPVAGGHGRLSLDHRALHIGSIC